MEAFPPPPSGDTTTGGRLPVSPPAADADGTAISAGRPTPPVMATTMEEIGRALEGHSLGPYHLNQFVGGGGMGAVFRATDTTLDRVVAVKVLSRQHSSDVDMLRRFKNEAQLAARLDHENIGRVHAVGSDAGWHFIVFEFIEGTNLRDVVHDEGPLDVPRALRFTAQVAEALEHASERGVVHRDIKPSNIIVTPAGRARLVDMGLARLPAVGGVPDLTESGMTLGTYDYISPEQARDPRAADVRSDLYSLGCTLFFMLSGRPPFADGTAVQKLLQHQQSPPPPVAADRDDIPLGLEAVVERLLQKEPLDRYQTPAQLVVDLVAIAAMLGIDLDVERARGSDLVLPRPAGSSWPWILPVVALLATIAGLWGLPKIRKWRLAATSPLAIDGGVGEAGNPAGDRVATPRRIWRIVDGPSGLGDVASLAAAIGVADDGDVVECAFSGVRDEEPCVMVGRRLTLRAAPGHDPVLRFSPPAGSRPAAGLTVVSGSFVLEGVGLRLVPASSGTSALFALGRGATLEAEGTLLEIREGGGMAERGARDGEAVFVLGDRADAPREDTGAERPAGEEDGSEPRGNPAESVVRFSGVQAIGAGTLLSAEGGAALAVVWSGGRCVTSGRFLHAEGGPEGKTATTIKLVLRDALLANREGFAQLVDAPGLPVMPILRVTTERCRFLTPPGRPFLEQAGIGQPDAHRAAIKWTDAGGRYEGGASFRRIDGAAEREEIPFSAVNPPLRHEGSIGGWSEGNPWDFPAMTPVETPRRPDS